MAQLRDAYQQFVDCHSEIIVIGPEKSAEFQRYWEKHHLPFVGLPDPTHTVLKLYGQKVNLFKLGRMPAQMIISKEGRVRWIHYGHSMRDIPDNEAVLALLDQINQEAIP